MLLEVVSWIGIVALILVVFASFFKEHAVLGVFAGLLFLFLGYCVLTDGVQIKVGDAITSSTLTTSSSQSFLDNVSGITYTNATLGDSVSSTTAYTFAEMTWPLFSSFKDVFGLMLVGLSLYTIWVFALKTTEG